MGSREYYFFSFEIFFIIKDNKSNLKIHPFAQILLGYPFGDQGESMLDIAITVRLLYPLMLKLRVNINS